MNGIANVFLLTGHGVLMLGYLLKVWVEYGPQALGYLLKLLRWS